MINMKSTNNILPRETDFVLKMYKIGIPKCKLTTYNHINQDCNNPHCSYDIKVKYAIEEARIREEDTFVGLKNIGSTCYVNCFLQLWFHNINIRKTILNWDPMDDEREKKNHTLFENSYEPMTEIGNLQLIFALMQGGNQQIIDPTPFTKSLDINAHVQEDWEEFQNLFLTFLNDKLKSQSNVLVREMVNDNFVGESNDLIMCLNCKTESVTGSQFREICLNIECYNSVTDSLQEYFNKEIMTGDNQYLCKRCDSEQNAVRKIVLTSLPHVLHFKLIRYVYVKNLMPIKKLNTEVRCPYTIDMGKYFNVTNESSKENHVYNLYGVLIHKGKNIEIGHYITHIKDIKTEEWYEMNDEKVTKLYSNNSNFHNGNIFKGLPSIKCNNIQKNEYKTTDAYMLMYISASLMMKLKTESTNCALSPRLTRLVNAHNYDYAFTASYENENFESMQLISDLIQEIKCNKVNKCEGDAISSMWISSLAQTKPHEKVNEINNEAIVCPHNKLNPNALHVTKYIGTELADKLYNLFQGGPRLRLNSSLCNLCVRNRSALLYMTNLTYEQKQFISRTLETASTNNNTNDKNNVQTYWLGINSLQCWPVKYLKKFQNFLKFNNILPNAPLPIDKDELVATCLSITEILDETFVKEDIKEYNIETDDMERKLSELDYNIIMEKDQPKDYMTEYFENLEIQRASIFKSNTDNNSLDYIYSIENTKYIEWTLNEDITCPHGNLCIAKDTMILVPEEVKNTLQTYFPKVKLFVKNTKPCSLCKAYYKNTFNPRLINLYNGIIQEKFLNTLVFNDSRPNSTEENQPYFCITKDFLESWQNFVSQPRENPLPLMINNKSLLCQDHNELLFEPTSNFVATDQSLSVIITKNEWLNLMDFYVADCGVFVYFDKEGIYQRSIPKVCQTCTNTLGEKNQFKDYIDKKIFIQVTSNNFKCYETDNEYEVHSVKKFKRDVASTNYASKYEAAAANVYNSITDYGIMCIPRQIPQLESITVSSSDTVFLLKIKIEEVFNVLPANQILTTASGKLLIENEANLRDLKIYPGSVIIVQFIHA